MRSKTIARKPDAPTSRRRPEPTARTVIQGIAPAPGSPRKKAAVAGPGRTGAPSRQSAGDERLARMQSVIVTSLEDDKAENVVVLDLAGRATFADRMVVATGLADRQISAMATHLSEKLREERLGRVLIEGAGGSDWVLIDAGDIVVHLFKPEARALYALERMWGPELDEASAADPVGTAIAP